jgi:C4-dicarboxylate transporter DctQ subunit
MSQARSFVDKLEENLIGILLGLMTLITFANVVARYVFNSNILWALEATVFMFGWLVLLGASYAVKASAHLGVDAITNMCTAPLRRILGLIAVTACILFAFFLLKGSWDYWANFANLPQTEGRWFPTGFQDKFRGQGWYETKDIPIPGFLRFLEDIFNEGEPYEKIPRLIPYFVMPLSMALLLFRFIQAAVRLWTGKIDSLIASHEAEDDIEDAAAVVAAADADDNNSNGKGA